MEDRLRILVLGYIVRCPLGGMAWHYLNYALGLAELGHDVFFIEDSCDYPSCYDPTRHVTDTDAAYGLKFADDVLNNVGLGDRWAYYDAFTSTWHGPCAAEALPLCKTAHLLINISGIVPMRPWLAEVPHRAFIDTDPVFEQVRQLTVPERRELAREHTAHFTFGENIPRGTACTPDDGLPWQPTRQPISLNAWPASPGVSKGSFTTVMQWTSYPAQEYNGVRYGQKNDSFAPYLTLPMKVDATLEVALGSASAPHKELRSQGWLLKDPLAITRDPWTYQNYIRASKAEFSVAKHGYVAGRSGWFSERTACYLASGRPVLVQDTGFTDWLETGAGVLAFSTPDEARAGIEEINRRYDFHSRSAREIAEAYFDAGHVLPRLIETAMAT